MVEEKKEEDHRISEHNTLIFNDEEFITGQNEREETTQDTIVTKSAAFASYEINYLTYITATYTRAKNDPEFKGLKTKTQVLIQHCPIAFIQVCKWNTQLHYQHPLP
jgi:hypothetical protein